MFQEEFQNMQRILEVLESLLKHDVYEDTGIVYKKGGGGEFLNLNLHGTFTIIMYILAYIFINVVNKTSSVIM